MMDNTARKASGWGDGLPVFVRSRMESLDMRPSLRQLAALSGVPPMTLQRNFHGDRVMSFETAKKLAAALQVSLDTLAEQSLQVEAE
ncbi:MAG: helix-turn-helix transcriptional regulator [Cyanobacteria bacterium SZAS TMP-1]|nr:helix-turn-helix transcriptional regulator [Cyanobacteria bacterium SZAS TMP-1]